MPFCLWKAKYKPAEELYELKALRELAPVKSPLVTRNRN